MRPPALHCRSLNLSLAIPSAAEGGGSSSGSDDCDADFLDVGSARTRSSRKSFVKPAAALLSGAKSKESDLSHDGHYPPPRPPSTSSAALSPQNHLSSTAPIPLSSLPAPAGRSLQLAAVSSALASAPPAFRTPHARGRNAWMHALETDRRNAITMQRQERLARARGVGKDVDVQSIISQVMHEGACRQPQRPCSSLFTLPLFLHCHNFTHGPLQALSHNAAWEL